MVLVSLAIALLFLFLFMKTLKSGQYDDMYTPSVRMLFEDEIISTKENKKSEIIK